MSHRTTTLGALAALVAVTACQETPTQPGEAPALAIAPGSITVQALTSMPGARGRSIGGEGTIFLSASASLPYGIAAWGTPGGPATLLIDAYGWPGNVGANAHGDASGHRRQNGIETGIWLKTGIATWSFVQTPKDGATDYGVNDLNDTRESVGFRLAGSFQPTFWPAPGALGVALPFPAGHTSGFADAINGAGDVAGRTKGSVDSPVLWQRTGPTSWTPVLLPKPTPSASGSAKGVNASRQVVGINNSKVYRWSPSGSSWTVTLVANGGNQPGIDNCGRVVGTVTVSGKPRGFVWDGTLTHLPLPSGADRSEALAISPDPIGGVQVITGWAGKGTSTSALYPVKWTIPACP